MINETVERVAKPHFGPNPRFKARFATSSVEKKLGLPLLVNLKFCIEGKEAAKLLRRGRSND